jgi:hypothetical protein
LVIENEKVEVPQSKPEEEKKPEPPSILKLLAPYFGVLVILIIIIFGLLMSSNGEKTESSISQEMEASNQEYSPATGISTNQPQNNDPSTISDEERLIREKIEQRGENLERLWGKEKPVNELIDFSLISSKFPDVNNGDYILKTEDGVLKAFPLNKESHFDNFFYIDKLDEAKKVIISLSVNMVEGSEDAQFGLVFFGSGFDNLNYFMIDGYKKYNIGNYEYEWHVESFENKHIIEIENWWNKIEIIYEEGNFKYYLNNVLIERRKSKIYGNSVGITFNSSAKQVWFDNIRVNATF